ncbi:CBS domain-containing protein [Skermanella sp. TT6]|uniref:CBS domain-containing protein n=1 Tax=Skermanella cutis TaxID=2775420 RepID=A0ABX7B2T3_9PROT|nr:CBS domain-containing protein [Skermanella sp. TT6]QQP88443.1 CBS domain-containing protein [Skermanella sp. TT6]
MQIREIMTRDVEVVAPGDTIQRAAKLMDELNVGVLPVCEGPKLVGLVTDRDITVRATSVGKAPGECRVSEVMTDEPRYCYEDDVVSDVSRLMGDMQIRRVPVLDRDDRLIGIVSLGDIATEADRPQTIADTLGQVSEPSAPDRG